MALCVSVDVSGALHTNGVPIGDCVSAVVLEPLDWAGASVWAMPSAGDLSFAYGAGLSAPLTLYLIAWSVGQFFKLFN